jgi:hypothetical protein
MSRSFLSLIILFFALIGCQRPPQESVTSVTTDTLVTLPAASVSLSQQLAVDSLGRFTPFVVVERKGRATATAKVDARGQLEVTADCDSVSVLVKKYRTTIVKTVPVQVVKKPWYFIPVLVLMGLLCAYLLLRRILPF